MMKKRAGYPVVLAAMALLVVHGTVARAQKRESELKDGFSITDVDESGEKKWEVIGSSARFISDDEMEIYDVRAFVYKKGEGDTLITTDSAIYNTKTKEIYSDQFVTVVTEDTVITGIGLMWKPKEKKIKIRSNVKMDIAKDEKRYMQ